MWEKLQSFMEGLFDKFKKDLIDALNKERARPSDLSARKCDEFFSIVHGQRMALTYGDVRLRTCHSEVLPAETVLKSRFSRNISLNIPVISSPMDTVTEHEMAIAMAKLGGLGVIHKGLSPEDQAKEVRRVKHCLSAFISDPIVVNINDTVEKVLKMREAKGYKFSSFPVVDDNGKMVGLATRSFFDYCRDNQRHIADIMSSEIVSLPEGAQIEDAYNKMMEEHIRILPVFDVSGAFKGIYTLSDVKRIINGDHGDYNLAKDGTLLVGAAIGVKDEERLRFLAEAKVDVFVIDTAHGDSKGVIDMVKFCKREYPHIDVVAGNVSEGESAKRLADAGADGVRVGQGPGSICTTRIVAGVGCPQVTAVYECSKALRGSGVAVCADGGIEYSGDFTIALGAGADCGMFGKFFAGTTESPGEVIYNNGSKPVKAYRGMGSLGAMLEHKASRERYGQTDSSKDKLVPEGVESIVDYRGDVSVVLHQLLGGLRSGMGYTGSKTIAELQEKADFWRISAAGQKESHPHGLAVIQNAPNYRV